MRYFVILILIFSAIVSQALGSDRPMVIDLDIEKLKKMSHHEIQELRYAYVHFMKMMDKDFKAKPFKNQKFVQTSPTLEFIEYLLETQKAYASDSNPNDTMCFYGGWPSVSPAKADGSRSNICDAPWTKEEDPLLNGYNTKYKKDSFCGSAEYFRCNPVLYGKPRKNSPNIVKPAGGRETKIALKSLSPEKGFCVSLKQPSGSYDTHNIAQRCADASAHQVDQMINDLREDLEKNGEDGKLWSDFKKMHEDIMGEGGFCDTYRPSFTTKTGKHHPACENLKERLAALSIFPGSNIQANQPPAEETQLVSAPNGNIALAVMQKCQEEVNEGERDHYNRQYSGFLADGLRQCGNSSEEDLERVSGFNESMDSIEDMLEVSEKTLFLEDLNDTNFSELVKATLVSEYQYGLINKGPLPVLKTDGSADIDKLMSKVSELVPNGLKEKARSDNYRKLAEEVVAGFNQHKDKLKREDSTSFMSKIKTQARELNALCRDVNRDYRKFNREQGHENPADCTEWVFKRCSANSEWIEGRRSQVNQAIQEFMARSGVFSIAGTESFRENGIDLETNFAERCAEDKGASIFNSNMSYKQLEAAVAESKEQIKSQFEDLNDKEKTLGNLMSNSDSGFEDAIEDYMKNDRRVVLSALLNTSPDKREMVFNRAMYVCKQIDETYSVDRYRRWGSAAVSLASFAVWGGACAISTIGTFGLGSGVGCGAVGLGAMAVSTSATVAISGVNYMDAVDRSRGANQNMASAQTDFTQRMVDGSAADNQSSQALTEGGLAVGFAAAGPILRTARVGYQYVKGGLNSRSSGGSSLAILDDVANNADDIGNIVVPINGATDKVINLGGDLIQMSKDGHFVYNGTQMAMNKSGEIFKVVDGELTELIGSVSEGGLRLTGTNAATGLAQNGTGLAPTGTGLAPRGTGIGPRNTGLSTTGTGLEATEMVPMTLTSSGKLNVGGDIIDVADNGVFVLRGKRFHVDRSTGDVSALNGTMGDTLLQGNKIGNITKGIEVEVIKRNRVNVPAVQEGTEVGFVRPAPFYNPPPGLPRSGGQAALPPGQGALPPGQAALPPGQAALPNLSQAGSRELVTQTGRQMATQAGREVMRQGDELVEFVPLQVMRMGNKIKLDATLGGQYINQMIDIAKDGTFVLNKMRMQVDDAGNVWQVLSGKPSVLVGRFENNIFVQASQAKVGATADELAKQASRRLASFTDLKGNLIGVGVRDLTDKNQSSQAKDEVEKIQAATKVPITYYTLEDLVSVKKTDGAGDSTIVSESGRKLYRVLTDSTLLPSEAATKYEVADLSELNSINPEQARKILNEVYPGGNIDYSDTGLREFAFNRLRQGYNFGSANGAISKLPEIEQMIAQESQVKDAFENLSVQENNYLEVLMNKATQEQTSN